MTDWRLLGYLCGHGHHPNHDAYTIVSGPGHIFSDLSRDPFEFILNRGRIEEKRGEGEGKKEKGNELAQRVLHVVITK